MHTKQVEIEVVRLKAKLGELGLFKTMHEMEKVTQKLGWEIAEIREREERSKRRRRRVKAR